MCVWCGGAGDTLASTPPKTTDKRTQNETGSYVGNNRGDKQTTEHKNKTES